MNEIQRIFSIIEKIDFSYTSAIDYDYNRVQADDHDESCADDYCRCSTIEDCVITKVNQVEFVRVIKEYLSIDTGNDSFNNDIINICKDLSDTDFSFNICGGYYGEEMGSITLESHIVNKLTNIFCVKAYRREKLKKIELNQKKSDYILDEYVKRILTEEYGYVLDSLKNSRFTIIEVNTKDIVFPQKDYNEFIKNSNLSGYKNKKGICGLVKKVDKKYHVIDGYHRINANLDKEKVKVILSYK